MKKAQFAVFAMVLALLASMSLLSPSSISNSAIMHAPRIRSGFANGASLNWAGYAVLTSLASPQSGAVTDVKGSWKVPAVSCKSTPNAYSSFWIGIDGYSSSTVEQIGTDSDCSSKKGVYHAWYEMYPAYPVNLNMKISPGDIMTAEVQYLGSDQFKLTITDTKTGATFSTTQTLANAQRSSAEWIAEAPSLGSSITQLANFGTAYFSNSQATINGVTGTISNSAWQNDPITMVTMKGTVKASPSSLSSDGSSFSLTWYHK